MQNYTATHPMTAKQDLLLIQNSFFIWLNAMVLFLTAIPTHHYYLGSWSIPKNYEILVYAFSIVLCALIAIVYRHIEQTFTLVLTRYRLWMLFYMPLSVLLYSFMRPNTKFIVVFIASAVGICFLIYDYFVPQKTPTYFLKLFLNYRQALLVSVCIAIGLIIWRSQGNTFTIISWKILLLSSLSYLFLRYLRGKPKYWWWLIPALVFGVTFFSMDDVIDYGNASFIVGPAFQLLFSHHHPLTISAQYGSGLAYFIAWYYQLLGTFYLDGFIFLLKVGMFIEYLIVYLAAFKFSRSHKIAFLALIAVLIFNFYSLMTIYYSFPQIGFIRFGLIYLIILCYLLENRLTPPLLYFLVSLIASIAAIWSFDSAVYVIPAVLFAEYSNKNLRQFLPIFISCLLTTVFIYLFPLLKQGQWHELARYYEYANLYAINSESFFSLPITRLTNLWWLYPALYVFILIQILLHKIKDKPVILLAVYGLATFTYFGGRAHPANLCHISIPFILLSVYLITHLELISTKTKQWLLAMGFSTFFLANYAITDFGNGVNADHMPIVKGIFAYNLPLLKQHHVLQEARHNVLRYKQNCEQYAVFNPYVENNSLAILAYDLLGAPGGSDVRLVDYYGCARVYNAFGVSPYLATTINPKAMQRVVQKTMTLQNRYILIDSRLLEQQKPLPSSATTMVEKILLKLQATVVGQFNLGNTTFVVFENKKNALFRPQAKAGADVS